MKNLLYKEFKLTGALITYLFLAFSVMVFIPSYPLLVSVFFICMGIFYTFQFAREHNDTIYTALLPVKKRDVVKAKYCFVVTLEIIAFVLFTIFTLIRMFLLKDVEPFASNKLMNANITFLGFALIGFTIFNAIFLGGFFKTAYGIGKPFLISSIVMFLLVGVGEAIHYFPGMNFLNSMSGKDLYLQLIVLGIGILVFVFGTILSYLKSAKRFEKLDI